DDVTITSLPHLIANFTVGKIFRINEPVALLAGAVLTDIVAEDDLCGKRFADKLLRQFGFQRNFLLSRGSTYRHRQQTGQTKPRPGPGHSSHTVPTEAPATFCLMPA